MLPRGGRSRRAGWLSPGLRAEPPGPRYSLRVQQQPRRLLAAQPVPLLEGGPAPALRPQIERSGAGRLFLRPRPGRGSTRGSSRRLPAAPPVPARGGGGGRAARPGPPSAARPGSPHAPPSAAAPRPPGGAAVAQRERGPGGAAGPGGGGGAGDALSQHTGNRGQWDRYYSIYLSTTWMRE